MKLITTPLPGVYEAETSVFQDERGRFCRLFCAHELKEAQAGRTIVQINHSLTRRVGAVRGLHFQYPPHAEAKWVCCLHGRVWDVALDIRRDSPTFLHWHAVELGLDRMNAIFIPEGCAHGFQVLEPDSELLYLHTAFYGPEHEGGLRWDDPRIGIRWPLSITEISDRDRNHPLLDESFKGVTP